MGGRENLRTVWKTSSARHSAFPHGIVGVLSPQYTRIWDLDSMRLRVGTQGRWSHRPRQRRRHAGSATAYRPQHVYTFHRNQGSHGAIWHVQSTIDGSNSLLNLQHQLTRKNFRPIHPSHLGPSAPGDIGLRVSWPPRPSDVRLLCASCSSDQDFACGFLPTPPRGGSSCRSARGSRHHDSQRTSTSKSLPERFFISRLSAPIRGAACLARRTIKKGAATWRRPRQ